MHPLQPAMPSGYSLQNLMPDPDTGTQVIGSQVLEKQLSASSRRPRSQRGLPFSLPLESLHTAVYKCALLDFTGKP